MQHPVGTRSNAETGRAELIDVWARLTNPTAVQAVPHAIFAAWQLASTFVCGLVSWWMVLEHRAGYPRRRSHHLAHVHALQGVGHPRCHRRCVSHRRSSCRAHLPPAADEDGLRRGAVPQRDRPGVFILTISTLNNCETAVRVIDVPHVVPFLAQGRCTGRGCRARST